MAGKKTKTEDVRKKAAAEDAPTQNGADAQSPMPLFYKNPVPVDSQAHKDWHLKTDFGFGFSREVNAIPINLIEMPQICHFYPIAFSPDDNATPVAILGLRDNENLFVREDGTWEDAYIPAYIRRYPFIFSETPESEQLTLCVDHSDTVVTEKAEQGAQPFFEEGGKPGGLLDNALEFCKSYHAAAQQTVAFSQALAQSGLLIERTAEIRVAGNQEIKFSGFRIVDEEKLAEMEDATFLEWRRKDWLPFLYAHLFSGSQWQRLAFLLNKRLAAQDDS